MNRTRLVLWTTFALVGLSAYFLLPTLRWYRMAPEERSEREQDRSMTRAITVGAPRQKTPAEVRSLRVHHNFSPDTAIADVATALRRSIDAAELDRVLATLPVPARDYWSVSP